MDKRITFKGNQGVTPMIKLTKLRWHISCGKFV